MIEDVEDELPDSDFSKASAIVSDEIYNGKAGVLPLSKFVDLFETLGESFHNDDLAGQLRKVYPNESGSLYRFAFVVWYVNKDVSLDSVEEAERLVGLGFKVSLMYLQ